MKSWLGDPGFGFLALDSWCCIPGFGFLVRDSRSWMSGSGYPLWITDFGFLDLDSGFLIPGFRLIVCGSWFWSPVLRFLVWETWSGINVFSVFVVCVKHVLIICDFCFCWSTCVFHVCSTCVDRFGCFRNTQRHVQKQMTLYAEIWAAKNNYPMFLNSWF